MEVPRKVRWMRVTAGGDCACQGAGQGRAGQGRLAERACQGQQHARRRRGGGIHPGPTPPRSAPNPTPTWRQRGKEIVQDLLGGMGLQPRGAEDGGGGIGVVGHHLW